MQSKGNAPTAAQKRMKKCKAPGCENEFEVFNSLKKACSPACALMLVEEKKRKDREKENRKAKRELNEQDRGWWLKKAQAEFNKYIRQRDQGLPCISCQRYHKGQIHAGHYRSVGANPELRFEESNCHAQCSACNNHLSGNIVNYRPNLMAKIGAKKLEWLEGPHEAKHYTIQTLKAIRDHYRKLNKEMEAA